MRSAKPRDRIIEEEIGTTFSETQALSLIAALHRGDWRDTKSVFSMYSYDFVSSSQCE